MYRYLSLLALLVLILFVFPASLEAQPALPHFQSTDCFTTMMTITEVECGYMIVPEDRSNPDGKQIQIALAIIKSRSSNPKPDPVIFLSGGPGSFTIDSFAAGLGQPLNMILLKRDVILIDQRGMGYSLPSLDCPEEDAYFEFEDNAQQIEVTMQCRDRLLAEGVNLAAYTTTESAADVADIRLALGLEEVNLLGGSYGSSLALAVMRDHPDGIRSVVLDGVTPLQVDLIVGLVENFSLALDRYFAGCESDPDCNRQYPDLRTTFAEVIQRANAEPTEISVRNPMTGEDLMITIDGWDLVNGLQAALSRTDLHPQIPILLTELNAGNYEVLNSFVGSLLYRPPDADGSYNSMRCSDDWLTTTPEKVGAAITTLEPSLQSNVQHNLADVWFEICQQWGVEAISPEEDMAVTSSIPTLLMGGELDPLTAPEWVGLAAETLENSYAYVFPNVGHVAFSWSYCAQTTAVRFFDNPHEDPAPTCRTK